jgi:hypothetical protein
MPLHCSSMYQAGRRAGRRPVLLRLQLAGRLHVKLLVLGDRGGRRVDDKAAGAGPGAATSGRGGVRAGWPGCAGAGLGGGAAASRFLAATAHAHGTGAAGDGGKVEDLGRGREDDVAPWDPRVGNENRETAGATCVLGMKIFLLNPQ